MFSSTVKISTTGLNWAKQVSNMTTVHRRGSGTVYRRGRIWWIQYFVRGRIVPEGSGSAEKADAENLLKRRIGEVAAGRRVGPERATILLICARSSWRTTGCANCATPSTWNGAIKRTSSPLWGTCWLPVWFGAGAAVCCPAAGGRRLRRHHQPRAGVVRRGFKLGAQEDPPLVQRQPAIAKLEEDNARQGFLEQDQYERLLEELPGRLKALFVCGYHTGARRERTAPNPVEQVISTPDSCGCRPLRRRARRPGPLPIYGDMRRWLDHQRETYRAGAAWVFHGAHNCPVDNHLKGWPEACNRAGLPGLLFHDLRRSAVRNMKRAGIQDRVAMEISGHRTRSIFDRYNIVDVANLQSAGERLEEYARRRKQERAAPLKRVK